MNENQIMEMFRQMTNISTNLTETKEILKSLVIRITNLEQGQANLEQGQANLEQGQAKLEQSQAKLEQGQVEIIAKVDRLQDDFEDFRDETRENFADLIHERKQDRRVVQMISSDLLDTKALLEETIERVEILEKKAA